jgi:glycine/D-amino acid oxidase-like deaminating enzyme
MTTDGRQRNAIHIRNVSQLHFQFRHFSYRSVLDPDLTMKLASGCVLFYCCVFNCKSIQAFSAMSMSAAGKVKNIVVIGGGIQGVSVAYHLAKATSTATDKSPTTITILEAIQPASAASGKGGGFMARNWGDGSPTQRLHELSFDSYEALAAEVGCSSYRKLPVLSVSPGSSKKKNAQLAEIMPAWLDETAVGRVSPMGWGDDTAQITPKEFVECMLAKSKDLGDGIQVVKGVCTGISTEPGSEEGMEQVTGVQYRAADDSDSDTVALPADAVIVAAGPWSCAAEDWFHGAVKLPMEGIKSTSIVWKKPEGSEVDATALFCGEDNRFNTHCKLVHCMYCTGLFL